jgi:formylglycine-generating enzyme required for sulfatase activity
VSEWCHDYYDAFVGSQNKVRRDPAGPRRGEFHVVRGSSWRHGSITELRLSYRDYTKSPRNDLGFRIARYVNIPK